MTKHAKAMGKGSAVLVALVQMACGSSPTATAVQKDAAGGTANGGSAGGGTSSGGTSSGGTSSGGTSNSGTSSGGTSNSGGRAQASCTVAPPGNGQVTSVTSIAGPLSAESVSASCDGSFVIAGLSSGSAYFKKKDGKEIDLSDAPIWMARYGTDGFPLWAQAVMLSSPGAGVLSQTFSDGSSLLMGGFNDSATFDPGGPNETKLGEPILPGVLFVARYGSDGSLKWAKLVTKNGGATLRGSAPGPNGSIYLVLDSLGASSVIGPGELDLTVPKNGSVIVELDANGHYTHTASAEFVLRPVLTAISGGDVLLVGNSVDSPTNSPADTTVIKDQSHSTSVLPNRIFVARFGEDLSLKTVNTLVDINVAAVGQVAGLSDGSIVMFEDYTNSITVGAGDPTETKFEGQGMLVTRYGATGHLIWATSVEGALRDFVATTLVVSPEGSIWASGAYFVADSGPAPLTIGKSTPNALTMPTTGNGILVMRLSSDGKPIWSVPFTGNGLTPFGLSPWSGGLIGLGNYGETTHFGVTVAPATSQRDLAIVHLGP